MENSKRSRNLLHFGNKTKYILIVRFMIVVDKISISHQHSYYRRYLILTFGKSNKYGDHKIQIMHKYKV
jgi:hypothetical protein